MEIQGKVKLIEEFAKWYNDGISDSGKISAEEIEEFTNEVLRSAEVSLKYITVHLLKRLSSSRQIDVTDSGVMFDDHYLYKRNFYGHIGNLYFDVYFSRDNEGVKIRIGKETECALHIRNMILSIEPKAIIIKD